MLVQTSLPNVREFLARALPWPQMGQQFYVNIHFKTPRRDDAGRPLLDHHGKPIYVFPGRALGTVEQAARTVEWANRLENNTGTDVYVCMSAQGEAEQRIGRTSKRPYLAAVRRMENALWVKSLYVDVDVKPDDPQHGYADTEEAVTEFTRIRKELGLPRPSFVVASGSGGFHAHWTFTEPVGADRWRSLSQCFLGGLMAKGFRGDTQCVIDVVRLLRLPGTFNHKGGQKRPVVLFGSPGPDYFISDIERPLAQFAGLYTAPALRPRIALGPPSAKFAAVTRPGLDEGVELNRPTIEQVAAGCPFIAATLANAGAANNNPLWLQTTNVALFTDDPRSACHRMSSGHVTYSLLETDNLFDRQLDTKTRRNLGWPRCQTIAAYGAPECQSCPHLAKGQSPLNFAVFPSAPPPPPPAAPIPLAQAALAPLPSAYSYDSNGLVCLVETDQQGTISYSPVCSFVMSKPWLQQDPPVLNFATFTHVGNEKQIRVPYDAVIDKNGFAKVLARQGMLVKHSETRRLGDFMVSWVEKMRSDATNVIQSQPFGWAIRGGKVEGFVYANHLWSKGVPRPSANPDPVLASQYSPTGEIEPWRAASKMITDQGRPALDAILASAFAGPLVRFTGQTGLLLSTYSLESGIGKSTSLRVAQAVWGHPVKAAQSLSDTQNSVIKKIGDIKSLPLYWDELKTDDDTNRFVNLAFQLSQGKEKSRLASDTTYREPGTWQTLLCCTSNKPLLPAILAQTKTTAAGLYRIFEFDVLPPSNRGQLAPTEAQLITAALDDNFGWAGLAYAQFLGANHERVAEEVAALAKSIEQKYDVRADERFWLALMTVLIAGAQFGNELGLTNISCGALAKFLVARFQDMRRERRTTTVDVQENINVLGILGRYLNENRRYHTVVTTNVHRGAGRAPIFTHGQPGAITLSGKTNETLIRSVRVQLGEQDHWARVLKEPFDEWLEQQSITPALIHRLLVQNFGVAYVRGRLCSGTALVTAQEPLFEFNFGDPKFQDLIEL